MEFDIRYLILILVNILKSIFIASSPSDHWDPFHIFCYPYPSFMTFIVRLFFLFLFSFIFSITSITIHHHPMTIRISSGYFSNSLNILSLASLLLPQVLYWYTFFIIITLSSWIYSNTWTSFRQWFLRIFSTIPAFSIFVTAEFDNNNMNQQPQTQTTYLLRPPV